MTVIETISECLSKMGEPDFLEGDEYSDQQQRMLVELINALNITYREIVSEYLPLVCSEEVSFYEGCLYTGSLERCILYPIRLTDQNGNNVNFKTYPDRIVAGVSGTFTLEYAYVPTERLDLYDYIEDMRITQGVLADGTLAHYYYANKCFDLARDFDAAYRSRVGLMRYKGKRLRMKQRGWTD